MEFNDATTVYRAALRRFLFVAQPHHSSQRRETCTAPSISKKLFALFVGFSLITLSALLNACQPSEACSPEAPDQAAVRILRTFYTADYRQRDHWLAVPPIGMWVGRITPFPQIAIQLRYKPLDARLPSMIKYSQVARLTHLPIQVQANDAFVSRTKFNDAEIALVAD
jgi:hypothetical protein